MTCAPDKSSPGVFLPGSWSPGRWPRARSGPARWARAPAREEHALSHAGGPTRCQRDRGSLRLPAVLVLLARRSYRAPVPHTPGPRGRRQPGCVGWRHAAAPLYCLVRFPHRAFCTIGQNMTLGLFNLSKVRYAGSYEHWALGTHDYRFSLQHPGDGGARAPGWPGQVRVGGSWLGTRGTRTDVFYLRERHRSTASYHSDTARPAGPSWRRGRGVGGRGQSLWGSREHRRETLGAAASQQTPAFPSRAPRLRPLHQEPVAQLERKQGLFRGKAGATGTRGPWLGPGPPAAPAARHTL